MTAIRLVTLDALHTLVAPRRPVHIQYADALQSFCPTTPPVDPLRVKASFHPALKAAQRLLPAYRTGPQAFWKLVVRETAVGAGVPAEAVDQVLPELHASLWHRFSSDEGYMLYDDSLSTLRQLREARVQLGLISNTDERMAMAISSLGIGDFFPPNLVLLSSLESIEKPNPIIFQRACERAGVRPNEALHVGDDYESDYLGANRAGMQSLLLLRPPPTADQPEISHVAQEALITAPEHTINSLHELVRFVQRHNARFAI